MNDAEIKKIVSETVAHTLISLGIDADDPVEFQKDMAHLRAWRESMNTVKRQSLLTAVIILTTGMIGLILMAIRGTGQ